jgi:hypothetical protein
MAVGVSIETGPDMAVQHDPGVISGGAEDRAASGPIGDESPVASLTKVRRPW